MKVKPCDLGEGVATVFTRSQSSWPNYSIQIS